jgi:hypothetical protein
MIKVYHAKAPTFLVLAPGSKPDLDRDFALVAEVATDDKNMAFQLTNTIDTNWWIDCAVCFHGSPDYGQDGCRSTSVGDVLVTDEGTFLVCGVGFEKVA